MPVKKTKEVIVDLLKEEGEMGTTEIYEMVCTILYHGVTMNQLGNLLSRSPQIEKAGFVSFTRNGLRFRERVWRLKNESQ